MPLEKLYSPAPGQLLAFWKIQESPEALAELVYQNYRGLNELDWIRNEGQRCQSLAVRMAAWHSFKALGMDPVLIPRKEKGPPQLTSGFISMSHCPELAAVFLSASYPVGLDIELPREQFRGIKERFLNAKELDWVEDNLKRITICWTVKEAVYKLMKTPGLSFRSDIAIVPGLETNTMLVHVRLNQQVSKLMVHIEEIAGHYLAYVSNPLFAGGLHHAY